MHVDSITRSTSPRKLGRVKNDVRELELDSLIHENTLENQRMISNLSLSMMDSLESEPPTPRKQKSVSWSPRESYQVCEIPSRHSAAYQVERMMSDMCEYEQDQQRSYLESRQQRKQAKEAARSKSKPKREFRWKKSVQKVARTP